MKFFAQPQPSDTVRRIENLDFVASLTTPDGKKFVQSQSYQEIRCMTKNESIIQGKSYVGIGAFDNINLLFADL